MKYTSLYISRALVLIACLMTALSAAPAGGGLKGLFNRMTTPMP